MCKLARDTTVIWTSEVEDKLRSYISFIWSNVCELWRCKSYVLLWCSDQGVAWTCRLTGVLLPATLFSVSLYRFFLCLVSFFQHYFSFWPFFFILNADPAGHALGSIYIWSLSPEFYFGKGISKSSWSAYWPSLLPEKNHKLSRHVMNLS